MDHSQLRVQGLGFRVQSLWFSGPSGLGGGGLGVRGFGVGFWVSVVGFRDQGFVVAKVP